MIRRLRRHAALAALLVLALVVPAFALSVTFNATVSVTDSNQTITFTDNHSGGTAAAFNARQILVRSSSASADTCFFDYLDGTATTADTPLEPGASMLVPMGDFYRDSAGFSQMGVVCDTGQTATFYVTAAR